jgi:DNA modification methylase
MTEHHILQGDVLDGLRTLPDCSVQCCITSPPYYGLRNYGVDGQIGLEETPEKFVQKITEVFREVRRVLRDDGTLWLNLGDSYVHGVPGGGCVFQNGRTDGRETYEADNSRGREKISTTFPGCKIKDMLGIPWRVAFALQADGWYLRSDIIWAKPNPMPESVTDRPTKAHEYIFLLTKSARYYYDADAVREAYQETSLKRYKSDFHSDNPSCQATGNPCVKIDGRIDANPTGRNIRTVWTITTQARPEAHFATFPDEIPRRCIKAGTSEYGCCQNCGKPWERIVDIVGGRGESWHDHVNDDQKGQRGASCPDGYKREFKGWRPGCTCDAGDPVPCVVLDPFMGSGTVAVIARELNRSSVGCELNPEYVKIIRKRLQADQQLDTGVVSYRFEKVEA